MLGLFGGFLGGDDRAVFYIIVTVSSLTFSSVVISQSQCGFLAFEGLIVPEIAYSTLLPFTVGPHFRSGGVVLGTKSIQLYFPQNLYTDEWEGIS